MRRLKSLGHALCALSLFGLASSAHAQEGEPAPELPWVVLGIHGATVFDPTPEAAFRYVGFGAQLTVDVRFTDNARHQITGRVGVLTGPLFDDRDITTDFSTNFDNLAQSDGFVDYTLTVVHTYVGYKFYFVPSLYLATGLGLSVFQIDEMDAEAKFGMDVAFGWSPGNWDMRLGV